MELSTGWGGNWLLLVGRCCLALVFAASASSKFHQAPAEITVLADLLRVHPVWWSWTRRRSGPGTDHSSGALVLRRPAYQPLICQPSKTAQVNSLGSCRHSARDGPSSKRKAALRGMHIAYVLKHLKTHNVPCALRVKALLVADYSGTSVSAANRALAHRLGEPPCIQITHRER